MGVLLVYLMYTKDTRVRPLVRSNHISRSEENVDASDVTTNKFVRG